MRIVSFLPAATEIVCALGLEKELVGITHECDHPPAVRRKPVVVRSTVDYPDADPGRIDRLVRDRVASVASIYGVDEALFRSLDPELLLTQDLCQVCAPSGNEVSALLQSLERPPEVLYFSPHSIEGIFDGRSSWAGPAGAFRIVDPARTHTSR